MHYFGASFSILEMKKILKFYGKVWNDPGVKNYESLLAFITKYGFLIGQCDIVVSHIVEASINKTALDHRKSGHC